MTIRAHQGNFDCFMSLSISAKADLHWCSNNETATNDALAKEQTVALTFDASCQIRLGLFLSSLLLSLSMPSSTNIHFTPITPMQFVHFSVPRPNTEKKKKSADLSEHYLSCIQESFETSMLLAITSCLQFGSGILYAQAYSADFHHKFGTRLTHSSDGFMSGCYTNYSQLTGICSFE